MFKYDESKSNIELKKISSIISTDENGNEFHSEIYETVASEGEPNMQVHSHEMDLEWIEHMIYSWASVYNFVAAQNDEG